MPFFGDGDAGGQALEPFRGLRFSAAGRARDTLPDPTLRFGVRRTPGVLTTPGWLLTLTGAFWAGCAADKPADWVAYFTGLGCCVMTWCRRQSPNRSADKTGLSYLSARCMGLSHHCVRVI